MATAYAKAVSLVVLLIVGEHSRRAFLDRTVDVLQVGDQPPGLEQERHQTRDDSPGEFTWQRTTAKSLAKNHDGSSRASGLRIGDSPTVRAVPVRWPLPVTAGGYVAVHGA